MKDLQNEEPKYPVIINKVGIKNISYPIRVLNKHNSYVDTTANISMYVSLMPSQRGTHMSRFIEVIERYRHNVTGPTKRYVCKYD